MTKSELINQIAKDANITKVQAAEAVKSFTTNVVNTLKKGERFTLIGFGSFYVTKRAARTGRHPQTQEPLKIKARKVPKFKAGKDFATKIGGKK